MDRPLNSLVAGLAIMGVVAVIVAGTLLTASSLALPILFTLPLVLFWPGFTLTAALFPRGKLDAPSRLLFSVELSLAITALGGLLLNWTQWGLRSGTWAVYLGAVTLGAVAIALIRWQDSFAMTGSLRTGLSLGQVFLLGLSALVIVGAFRLARLPAPQPGLEGYTMLWVQSGSVSNNVRVGVQSQEFAATSYELQFELSDVVYEGPTFRLEPGKTWEGFVNLHLEQLETVPLTVFLYRLDDLTQVYRHVVWWPETLEEGRHVITDPDRN